MVSLASPLTAARPQSLGLSQTLSSRRTGSALVTRSAPVSKPQGAFRAAPTAPQRLAVRLNSSSSAALQTFDESDVQKIIATGGDVSVNYDFDRWTKHESPWRYWRHMVKIFRSRVLLELKWVIAAVAAVSAAVCATYTYGAVICRRPLPSVPSSALPVGEGARLAFVASFLFAMPNCSPLWAASFEHHTLAGCRYMLLLCAIACFKRMPQLPLGRPFCGKSHC